MGKGGLLRWKLLVASYPPSDGRSCSGLVTSGPQASPPLRWILLCWSSHLRPTGLPGCLRVGLLSGWFLPWAPCPLPPSVPVGCVSVPVEVRSRVTWSATPTSLEWCADRKLEHCLYTSPLPFGGVFPQLVGVQGCHSPWLKLIMLVV